jgi:hypothetical protein
MPSKILQSGTGLFPAQGLILELVLRADQTQSYSYSRDASNSA